MYFIFSFWPLFAISQVSTGFESGLGEEWDQFPENRWESSPDQALSGMYSLHHSFDNTASGTDRISFETGIFDTKKDISWEFTLKHGYTTSSSNSWQIYLASDKSATELNGSMIITGYIFGVNISGSDDTLRLYAMRKGKLSMLCSCSLNYENDIGTVAFHCIIKRDSAAAWEIYVAKAGSELQLIGAFQEPNINLPVLKHFGLSYSYTSTKDRLLWFDDLSVQASFITDTIPPKILRYEIPGRNTVILELSEEIDISFLQKEQFILIPGNIYPEKVMIEGLNISCYFREEFMQRTNYKLNAINLIDKEGNISSRDSIEFLYYQADKNDLVFTEIMADPSPAVYLRESEYIELYNRCGFPLNLDSCILQTGKKEWILPRYIINPGEYLVVTSGSESGINTLPLFTSSSVITNDGQQILLKNKYGEIITASEFYSDWYGDDYKSQGGWSLERIDANNLCGGKENWKASVEYLGGTPGFQNSVQGTNIDITAPFIERLEFISENKIRLVFSENIDPLTLPVPGSFRFNPVSSFADSVLFPEIFCKYAEIVCNDTFKNGSIYKLTIPEGIRDCAGNPLEAEKEIRLGLPASAGFTDIIISEIMFTTFPGCPEYIELYNLSDKLLDLSDLRICVNQKGETGKPAIPLKNSVLFFPGEYLVICNDKQALLTCHDISDPGIIIEAVDMPSLRDDGACIQLINRSLEPVDVFCYEPEDEFPMLSDTHGVSLERLSLDRKTGDESFWHSASSVAGFGTPGKVNSQSLSGIQPQSTFEITPEIFTPNNDGFNDLLEIHYSVDKEGFVGTVVILDPTGRRISFLGENEILGTSGMFLWDGRDDQGNICKTGLYLVYAEIWNLKGEKERFKKVAVLVRE
jgi:hypothetical protein